MVDKQIPATSYLSPSHKAVFDDNRVEFKQANLVNQGMFAVVVVYFIVIVLLS